MRNQKNITLRGIENLSDLKEGELALLRDKADISLYTKYGTIVYKSP